MAIIFAIIHISLLVAIWEHGAPLGLVSVPPGCRQHRAAHGARPGGGVVLSPLQHSALAPSFQNRIPWRWQPSSPVDVVVVMVVVVGMVVVGMGVVGMGVVGMVVVVMVVVGMAMIAAEVIVFSTAEVVGVMCTLGCIACYGVPFLVEPSSVPFLHFR